jgi:hypothetical protein
VKNTPSVAVGQDIKDLVHDVSGSGLRDGSLFFDNRSKRLAIAEFHNNKVSVTVLVELINFINKGVIDLLKLIDLLFESFSLIGAYLVLVDDID